MNSESNFTPSSMDYESHVRANFNQHPIMQLINAELVKVIPGETEIQIPFRQDLTHKYGCLHAGIITTIMDTACGSAAMSLLPADATLQAVEFKVNFLSPAKGELCLARGSVIKAGRTIIVCSGKAFSIEKGMPPKLVAIMTGTLISVEGFRFAQNP